MEYLVRAHDTKMYYVSNESIGVIRETCPVPGCNGWDTIVLSYEEGEKDLALEEYFSKAHNDTMDIITGTDAGLTKKNICQSSIIHFQENEKMIVDLYNSKVISKEDMKKYLIITKQAKKNELKRINKSLRLHLTRKERKGN